jgi:hypothetical protein
MLICRRRHVTYGHTERLVQSLQQLNAVAIVGIKSKNHPNELLTVCHVDTEVLSSDGFRGLVSDDGNDQSAPNDAFATLHYVAARSRRLRREASM